MDQRVPLLFLAPPTERRNAYMRSPLQLPSGVLPSHIKHNSVEMDLGLAFPGPRDTCPRPAVFSSPSPHLPHTVRTQCGLILVSQLAAVNGQTCVTTRFLTLHGAIVMMASIEVFPGPSIFQMGFSSYARTCTYTTYTRTYSILYCVVSNVLEAIICPNWLLSLFLLYLYCVSRRR